MTESSLIYMQRVSAGAYKLARKMAWGEAYNIELQQRAARSFTDCQRVRQMIQEKKDADAACETAVDSATSAPVSIVRAALSIALGYRVTLTPAKRVAVTQALEWLESLPAGSKLVAFTRLEASELDHALGNSMNDGADEDVFVQPSARARAWRARRKIQALIRKNQ
jgi:hypothetical protein